LWLFSFVLSIGVAICLEDGDIHTLTTVLELRPKLKPEPPNIYIYVYRERASERARERQTE